MVTTLEHGVTEHDDAEGSIVQSLDVEATVEESNLSGMVAGVTETVKSWTHTAMNKFSVTGSGDLTLAVGASGDAQLSSLISGGQTNILSFKLSQKLGNPSEWTYSGNHHPHVS